MHTDATPTRRRFLPRAGPGAPSLSPTPKKRVSSLLERPQNAPWCMELSRARSRSGSHPRCIGVHRRSPWQGAVPTNDCVSGSASKTRSLHGREASYDRHDSSSRHSMRSCGMAPIMASARGHQRGECAMTPTPSSAPRPYRTRPPRSAWTSSRRRGRRRGGAPRR